MTYSTFARRETEAPASQSRSVSRPAAGALRIGDADDPYEREADRVADEVVSASPRKQHWSLSNIRPSAPLQRKCACGSSGDASGECAECKQKREGHQILQRKASSATTHTFAPPIVSHVLNSAGQPLDKPALDFFERAYGQALADVRIHSDEKASESAKAIGARAYTAGKHVVFGEGEYAPRSHAGQRLLAHELTHALQQDGAPVLRRQPKPEESGGKIRPLVQKFIRGDATQQEKQTLRDLLMADQLRPEEIDALKRYIGRIIADQVVKQAVGGQQGQININIGGPIGNVHTYFKAKLRLKLSGAARVLGGGLEGTLETLAEVNADNDKKKVTVHITPPPGNTMLAELVRAKAFPNGELTFELGEQFVKALNMISLGGELTITLTGKKASEAGGLVISSPDIPEDVELEATLSQSADRPELAPATGDPARPPIRAFATGGIIADPKQKGAATTVGLDVPLGNDTRNPLIYAGFGLRAGADTRGGARAGGAGFVGLNLNPVMLQLAFEAGISRFPASQTAAGSGAQAGGYFGAEASVGVRVTKRVEVMALASLIGGLGGHDVAGAGSVQLGAGFTF